MMDRRAFIHSSLAAGAVALSGRAPRAAATAPAASFRLLRWPDDDAPQVAARVRVWLDAFVPAAQPVLARFHLQALFDTDAAFALPFHAWSYRAGCMLGNSRRTSFTAPARGVRSLAIDYAFDGESSAQCRREECPTTSLLRPHWLPGRYVLAGPRADGRAADLAGLAWSGDEPAPLRRRDASAPDFDYLALRVEALDA